MESYLKQRIKEESLGECVQLCGKLAREEVQEIFQNSHLHLLTSSYEANTTVMFEAMEECVPSIVFDHFGMADLVIDDKTGKKIPTGDYETMVNDYAATLDDFIENPEKIRVMSLNLREASKNYTTENRESFFEKCYQLAVKNYEEKHK